MIRNKLSAILAITCIVITSLTSKANASLISIDFDKGTIGNTVGNFYSESGITFNNTKFVKNFSWPGSSGKIGIAGIGGLLYDGKPFDFVFSISNAIDAMFSQPISYVGITGINVGPAGMQMDAYDISGNLLKSESWYGDNIIGTGQYQTISIGFADPIISKILLYQPKYDGKDGMVFDNLSFQKADDKAPVPIPASILILGSGLISLFGARLKKRRS